MKIKLLVEDIKSKEEEDLAEICNLFIKCVIKGCAFGVDFKFEDGRECHVTIR